MDYMTASVEMKIKEDGNPKFEIIHLPIAKWDCHTCKSGMVAIYKDGQYWDQIDNFWEFRNIARDEGTSPFNPPYIRGVKKHDANHVFDEDKSVKWNRNAVIEYNKTVDSIQTKNKTFQEETEDVFNVCASACIKYVFNYSCLKRFEISQDEIDYIIAKAKEHDYDFPYELVDRIEDYCQFYLELIKKRENNA